MSRSDLASLGRDSVRYGVAKLVPAGAMFAGVILFVRAVGEAEYGRFSLVFAAAAAVSSITVGWVNQGQLRFHSRYAHLSGAYQRVIRNAQKAVPIGMALLAALAWGVGGALGLSGATRGLILGGGALAAGLAVHTVRISTFQAQLRAERVVALEAIRAVAHLALPLALLTLIAPTAEMLLLGVAGAYAAGSVLTRPWHSGLRPGRVHEGRVIARTLWRYGWPLSLWLAVTMGFQISDRVLIEHVYSFEVTGAYASAYDLIVRSFSLLFFPLTLAVHPRIMKAWNDGEFRRSLRLIGLALAGQALLYIPLLGGLLLVGRGAFEFLLGADDVALQVDLLVPLSLAGLAWQIALLAHKPLELMGRTRTMLVLVTVVWVSNVAANWLLLPAFGPVAVAYTFAAAGFVYGAAAFGLGARDVLGRVFAEPVVVGPSGASPSVR